MRGKIGGNLLLGALVLSLLLISSLVMAETFTNYLGDEVTLFDDGSASILYLSEGNTDYFPPESYDTTDPRFTPADSTTTNLDSGNTMDQDGDGVQDMYDVCPDTPANAKIIQKVTEPINYQGENVNRLGCTCAQLREQYDFASNDCAYFECYEDTIFELRERPYDGGIVECPTDTCEDESYTYYDYPPSGYPRCEKFEFIPYACEATITYNATQCGFILDNEEQDTEVENGTESVNSTVYNKTEDNTDIRQLCINGILDDLEEGIDCGDVCELPCDIEGNETNITSTNQTTHITQIENEVEDETSIQELNNTTLTPTNTVDEIVIEQPFKIPELNGSFKKRVPIRAEELRFAYPRISKEGTNLYFEILLLGKTNPWPSMDYELFVDNEHITKVVTTDRNDNKTNVYLFDVLQLPQEVGYHTIQLQMFDGKEELYAFEGEYEVRVPEVRIPIVPETNIVVSRPDGELEAEDYAFVKAVHEELELQYETNKNLDAFKDDIDQATKKLRVNKEKVYDKEENKTTFVVHIEPKENEILENVTIIEYIPKEIAKSAQDIIFNIPPTKILADDPLIMWHFSAVDERIDLEYKVDGDIQATGNTIATVAEVEASGSPWHIVVPVIVIPLLILLLVIFPHMHKHHKPARREGEKEKNSGQEMTDEEKNPHAHYVPEEKLNLPKPKE